MEATVRLEFAADKGDDLVGTRQHAAIGKREACVSVFTEPLQVEAFMDDLDPLLFPLRVAGSLPLCWTDASVGLLQCMQLGRVFDPHAKAIVIVSGKLRIEADISPFGTIKIFVISNHLCCREDIFDKQ